MRNEASSLICIFALKFLVLKILGSLLFQFLTSFHYLCYSNLFWVIIYVCFAYFYHRLMYFYHISLSLIGLFVFYFTYIFIFRMMMLRVVGRSWCLAAGGGTGPLRRHSPPRPQAVARRTARPLRTSSSFELCTMLRVGWRKH